MLMRHAVIFLFISIVFRAAGAVADTQNLPEPAKIEKQVETLETKGKSRPLGVNDPGALVIPGRDFGMRKGDVIEAINGVKVSDPVEAEERLLREGAKIHTLKVRRAGKLLKLKRKPIGDPRD